MLLSLLCYYVHTVVNFKILIHVALVHIFGFGMFGLTTKSYPNTKFKPFICLFVCLSKGVSKYIQCFMRKKCCESV